jgi:hypothetical protein
MSAATANRSTPIRHPEGAVFRVRYPVATAVTIYKGTIVMLVAGYLKPAADAAGGIVVGVAQEKVVNAGADGAAYCDVDCNNSWRFVGSGIVAADVGKTAYVADDQTVQDATGTNSIVAGFIEELESANVVWVRIGRYS